LPPDAKPHDLTSLSQKILSTRAAKTTGGTFEISLAIPEILDSRDRRASSRFIFVMPNRTGSPATGDAKLIRKFGDVPENLLAL
jgi:hypothetical protein